MQSYFTPSEINLKQLTSFTHTNFDGWADMPKWHAAQHYTSCVSLKQCICTVLNCGCHYKQQLEWQLW